MRRLLITLCALGWGATAGAQPGEPAAAEAEVVPPAGLRSNRATFSPVVDALPARGSVTEAQLEEALPVGRSSRSGGRWATIA